MEEHLNELAKNVGKQFQDLLKQKGLYDKNIDIDYKVGKYSILFGRRNKSLLKMEPLVNLPAEFFVILNDCVVKMHELWHDHEESGIYGDDTNSDYFIECIIDDEIDVDGTIAELRERVLKIQTTIDMNVKNENYEEAAKLKKTVDNILLKIQLQNTTDEDDISSDTKEKLNEFSGANIFNVNMLAKFYKRILKKWNF